MQWNALVERWLSESFSAEELAVFAGEPHAAAAAAAVKEKSVRAVSCEEKVATKANSSFAVHAASVLDALRAGHAGCS